MTKTQDLTGAALDWAVAKCEGIDSRNNWQIFFIPYEAEIDDTWAFICHADNPAHGIKQCKDAYPGCNVVDYEKVPSYSPSTNWAQGGPLIEKYEIDLKSVSEGVWQASNIFDDMEWHHFLGYSPLVAAMRCFVASKLGDEVDVPEGLT